MSGTHSATLLVADGLARRGWEVGLLANEGGQLTETSVATFSDFAQAHSWIGNSRAVWSYHGDDGIMEKFSKARIQPIIWSHIDLTAEISEWLHQERIAGVVTVSDYSRLALLHHPKYRRISRIYNPLNPFYTAESGVNASNLEYSRRAIFAGYVGESKGAHRMFQYWRHVRRALPDAQLVVAGSTKLYREDNLLGLFGVANQEFEERYIYPLVQEFGSLEGAGVHFAGLLSPAELRAFYQRSSLGVVNLNWEGSGETFSCTAIEMVACGLRVFSVASGALPETVGFTGNAILVSRPDQVVPSFIAALSQPKKFGDVAVPRQQVCERYRLSRIVDNWEELLRAQPDHFYDLAGPWQFDKDFRYFVKRILGPLRAGGLLDRLLELRTRLKKLSASS